MAQLCLEGDAGLLSPLSLIGDSAGVLGRCTTLRLRRRDGLLPTQRCCCCNIVSAFASSVSLINLLKCFPVISLIFIFFLLLITVWVGLVRLGGRSPSSTRQDSIALAPSCLQSVRGTVWGLGMVETGFVFFADLNWLSNCCKITERVLWLDWFT